MHCAWVQKHAVCTVREWDLINRRHGGRSKISVRAHEQEYSTVRRKLLMSSLNHFHNKVTRASFVTPAHQAKSIKRSFLYFSLNGSLDWHIPVHYTQIMNYMGFKWQKPASAICSGGMLEACMNWLADSLTFKKFSSFQSRPPTLRI